MLLQTGATAGGQSIRIGLENVSYYHDADSLCKKRGNLKRDLPRLASFKYGLAC